MSLTFIPFQKKVYSQNGEDGIIDEILKRLGISSGEFVEFGAWDGKHLSNTFHLVEQGWNGVYIEEDREKFNDLVDTRSEFPEQLIIFNKRVDYEGESTLDNILRGTSISEEFELLSIDIDSYDYHIWKSLKDYQPLIVIIEINSYIRPGIEQIHRQTPHAQGSSFTSTLNLGIEKGYTAVCHTGNMIFVRNDHVDKLTLSDDELNNPETLFIF